MTVKDTSTKGIKFIHGHEGNPLTAYLDPVGVPTIGAGATNRSRIATAYLKAIGVPNGKIIAGKTKITSKQSEQMFAEMLDKEYEKFVIDGMPKDKSIAQHQFDAMVSAVYNLGPKFMGWRWMKLWKEKSVRAAADYWSRNYNTAAGRKLAGLVRRRKEEAKLFEHGIYTGVAEGEARKVKAVAPKQPDPVVIEAQETLKKLGVGDAKVDGWLGPKTRAAILEYQKQHPHLVNDGILGKATLSQLRRDALAVKETLTTGGGAVASSGFLSFFAGFNWQLVLIIVIIGVIGYFGWKYRDVIQRRWNKLTGKTVEV